MLFVEEMPGERCSLFERAVADSPVLSFSFLAVPNLILFCVFFLGTGDDGFMMMMMTTMMLLLFLLSFLTSTPFLSVFLTLGKLSTTELHLHFIQCLTLYSQADLKFMILLSWHHTELNIVGHRSRHVLMEGWTLFDQQPIVLTDNKHL